MAERDVSKHPDITTISQFILTIEDEIRAVRNGELTLEMARVIRGMRHEQLSAKGLHLQYQRLLRGKTMQELKMVEGKRVDEKPPQLPGMKK